jgi:hypothetical protein
MIKEDDFNITVLNTMEIHIKSILEKIVWKGKPALNQAVELSDLCNDTSSQ